MIIYMFYVLSKITAKISCPGQCRLYTIFLSTQYYYATLLELNFPNSPSKMPLPTFLSKKLPFKNHLKLHSSILDPRNLYR